jgi:hypothetical protein
MKFKSHVATQVSGSTGGTTYAQNQGGMYMRARSIPTNPNSPGQAALRTVFKGLMSAWTNTLTAAQRAAWNVYSVNVKFIDKLGSSISIGGVANYVRANTPRVQNAQSRIDNAPVVFNIGAFTQPTFAITHASTSMVATFTTTDSWNSAGGCMLLYASRPQNQSINFFKGPFRLVGVIPGGATSPQTFVLPFTAGTTASAMFVKTSVSQVDGRLSSPSIVKSTPV